MDQNPISSNPQRKQHAFPPARKRIVLGLLVALAALSLAPARAATFTWDASGSNAGTPTDGAGTWSTTGTNWSNGTVDAGWNNGDVNDNAVFGNANGAAGTVTVGSVSVGNITFNAPGSGSYTLSSGTITLTSGTITTNASSAAINSVIAGSVGLTTGGAGTLTLGGANTYTGTTAIGSGEVILNSASGPAIPGNVTLGGANLASYIYTTQTNQFGSGSAITFANTASAYARLDLGGNNQTVAGLSSSSNFSVVEDAGGFAGATALHGATLTLAPAAGATYSFGSGFISDYNGGANPPYAVSLVMSGSGQQTLSGGNITYSGATTVNTGTLVLQGITAFNSTPTVNSGGTLVVQNSTGLTQTTTVNSGGTMVLINTAIGFSSEIRDSGLITGAGTLTINCPTSGTGGGWVEFNSPSVGLSNFTGTVNVLSGVLAMNNTNGAWSGNPELNVMSGGLYALYFQSIGVDALTGNGDVFNGFSSSATLTVGAANGSGTFSGVIHGNNTGTAAGQIEEGTLGLTKTGTGTEVLAGANTYTGATTVNGGTLQIGNGSTGSLTNSTTLTVSTGTGTLAFDEANAANQTQNIADSGTVMGAEGSGITNTLSGAITGAGGFTQSGAGQTSLTGASSYTGATLVNSGTLAVSNIAAYSSGTTTIGAGAVFSINNSTTQNSSAKVIFTGSGTLLMNGPGTYDVGGGSFAFINMSAGGLVNIEGGTMQDNSFSASWASNLGSVNIASGATLDLYADNGQMDALTGGGALQNSFTGNGTRTATIGISNGSGTFSGIVGGSVGTGAYLALTKTGTGTEILTGANTYTGSTTINAGVLQIGNGGATGSIAGTSGVFGLAGGTLVFDTSTSGSMGGAISGGIGVTQNGSATETLNNATYTGPTTVNSGTLAISNGIGSFASGTTTFAANSTFSVSVPSGSQTVSHTINFTGAGTLLMNGPGTWVVGASGVHANFDMSAGGLVDIEGGTIQDNYVGSSWGANFGSVKIASGATLDLYAENGQMDALIGSGTLQNGFPLAVTATIGVSNGSGTFSGVIANAGSGTIGLTKTGTGTEVLTGANTYTLATTINAGTLQLGNGGATGSIASTSGISGSAGGTLAFDLNTSGNFSKSISGALNVTQAGSGVLTLAGSALGYSGTTSVTNGTLIVAGSISGNGPANVTGGTLGGGGTINGNVTVGNELGAAGSSVLWPSAGGGSAGTLLTTGNLTLNSDAAFQLTLNSSEAGISDAVQVNGTLTLTGALLTGLDAGNSPLAPGSAEYIIAGYSSLSGYFANAPSQDSLINIGQNWFEVDYGQANFDEITLIAAVPEPSTWATVLVGAGLLCAWRRRGHFNHK